MCAKAKYILFSVFLLGLQKTSSVFLLGFNIQVKSANTLSTKIGYVVRR